MMLFGMAKSGDAQCTNTCVNRIDYECDDGGPGSEFSYCPYGTDCYDCGSRGSSGGSGSSGSSGSGTGSSYSTTTTTTTTTTSGSTTSGGSGSGTSGGGTGSSGSTTTTTTTTTTSSSSSSSTGWSSNPSSLSGDDDCDDGGSPAVVIQALMCATAGVLGVFLAVVLVLPDKSRSEPPKEDAGTAGAMTIRTSAIDQKGGTQGWGPWGWLFPRVWVKVWFGYMAMLLLLSLMAMIPSVPGIGDLMLSGCNHWFVDLLMTFGPFIHCGLMPVIWMHKHREVKKMMETPAVELEATTLDPEAKTVIFAVKGGCKVLLADIFCGIVSFALYMVRRASLGSIDLRSLWFPAPFYNFYKAKMLVQATQIDGCRICITATQADAYMKFCTETMMNFWTLGFYGRCCSKRTNYGRWLDRHIMWQGKPPPGYNNQFRIFDDKLSLCQKFQIFMLQLLLSLLTFVPFANQILPWYNYKTRLRNMKFGGSDPYFDKGFTVMQYITKWCTVGACGCCGTALKRWVDTNIRMGEPKFDEEMAAEDAEADAANPDEQTRRMTNQSMSGPPGFLDPNRGASFGGQQPTAGAPPMLTEMSAISEGASERSAAKVGQGMSSLRSGSSVGSEGSMCSGHV